MYEEKEIEDKVYKVSDLQRLLKLSRTKAYGLCDGNEFPIMRIGNTIRIPITSFNQWFQDSVRGAK